MKRAKPSGDKWSNYTSASDLGLAPGEEAPSSYEIEQMVRGRTTKVGEWEEVVVPSPSAETEETAEKRKAEEDPEDLREFKLQQKKHADPYDDDDDWDPAALTTLKFKSREKKIGEKEPEVKSEQSQGSVAGPSGWAKAEVKTEPPEGVKAEPAEGAEAVKQETGDEKDAAPAVRAEPAETPAPAPAGGSLFKKRRPPPSSRKK